MENQRKVVLSKEDEENDDEERKHFCKIIAAFRFYRLVQLQLNSFRCLHDFAKSRRDLITMLTPCNV